MGVDLLTEEHLELPGLGEFDCKPSIWVKAPVDMRKLDRAFYGEHRYGRVFMGHTGTQSYYTVRGFWGWLRV